MKNFVTIALLLSFALIGCAQVNPGKVGVKVMFGDIRDSTLSSGFHMTGFANVHEISLQSQTLIDQVDESSNEAAIVRMEDTLQTIGYTANVQWHVRDGDAARELFEHFNLRQNKETEFGVRVLIPVLREGLKQVFNEYELQELIENRDQAAVNVEETVVRLLEDRLVGQGEELSGAIVIDDVALTNVDYDENLEQAFRATIQARQQQELAEQNLQRDRIEMELQVAQAEATRRAEIERITGEAEGRRIQAEGEADAMRMRAEAERYQREQQAEAEAAFYQGLYNSGVDPNMYIYSNAWNGSVPYIQTGGESGGDVQTLIIPQIP